MYLFPRKVCRPLTRLSSSFPQKLVLSPFCDVFFQQNLESFPLEKFSTPTPSQLQRTKKKGTEKRNTFSLTPSIIPQKCQKLNFYYWKKYNSFPPPLGKRNFNFNWNFVKFTSNFMNFNGKFHSIFAKWNFATWYRDINLALKIQYPH